jgi:hypothetical protein
MACQVCVNYCGKVTVCGCQCHVGAPTSESKAYLGDGVYVDVEHGSVVLMTERATGVERIYLEPQVLRTFEEWLKQRRSR